MNGVRERPEPAESSQPGRDAGKKAFGRLPRHWRFHLGYVVLTVLLVWFWQEALEQMAFRTIPYSEFKAHLARGEVSECVLKEAEVEGIIRPHPGPAKTPAGRDGKRLANPSPFAFRAVRVEDPNLAAELQDKGVRYWGARPGLLSQLLWGWLVPIGIMILLWAPVSRGIGSAGEMVLGLGKSRARLVVDRQTGVTFDDVAGCEEAKAELREVVDFLAHPERYRALGAAIPKGVLLIGPPGTGKTLLARAVAGEAGVPFFSLSGSDFVEMFVGIGTARVRDLFQQAKAQAPCIIFIDELDAIGRQRGVHLGPVNDEREQTLNQLLVEMDGFEVNAGVIVLGATNRPEVMDRALLRPGRFDRQVVLDAPDLDGREAILRIHARGKPLAPAADLRAVARATAGFSGADLANLMNEASLAAARRHATQIEQRDLDEAVEKVVAGPQRKSRRLQEEEKRRIAYHEAGHALVAAFTPQADPVHRISIIPRGRAALGYTMQLPADDRFLLTRSALLARIRVMLGGRAAEEVRFGEVTTGAENDLERATAVARQMVCTFGMSEAVGLVHCAHLPAPYLSGEMDGALQRDCSESTAREIDEEMKALLDSTYAEAKQILSDHREELESAARELLRRETLDAETFHALIGRSATPVAPSRS